jgi:methylase of polypeptide subunit release factors
LSKLKAKGKMFIEFDETSKKEIENFLKKENLKNYQFQKDQFNNNRILIIWN